MDPANRNNFISIFSGGTVSLPQPPMRELGMVSPAMILTPGENYVIYINDLNHQGGNIILSRGFTSYSLGAGSSVLPLPGGGVHSVVTFSCDSVPDGIYSATMNGLPISPVEVINDAAEANTFSALFRWSHNKILGDIYYPYISSGFMQCMRLRTTFRERQSELDKAIYEPTVGKARSLRGTLKKYIILETQYNLWDHEAMMMLSLHDNILINNVPYILKPDSSYKYAADISTPISVGEVGFYNNNEAFKFRC